MEDKLVTLAILTYSKAQILKTVLENEGIEAYIHNINLIQPVISSGVRVRIKESDSEVLEGGNREKKEQVPVVLVPIDFSPYSLKACDMGFEIASHLNATVTLLHVYFSPIFIPELHYDTDSYQIPPVENVTSIKNTLEKVHNQFSELTKTIDEKIQIGIYPNIKYNCILREGVPEEEILQQAKSIKPLIIVMGTRGENQENLELIGSVTAEVIERSPCFVYAIPENAQFKKFDNIHKVALFTSFDQRDLIAFDSLITTFQHHNFEISFIHINSHEEKRQWNEIKLVGIKEYFKKQYPQLEFNYSIIDEENLLDNLDKFMKENSIDVMCTTNYRRNVFARLFNPSMAKKMLFHTNTPLLIIK